MPAYGAQATPTPVAPAPAPGPQPVAPTTALPQYLPYGTPDEDRKPNHSGSTYIPVDNWIYPAMTRLYSLGYADTLFLGMRPWTRQSVLHVLDESEDNIRESNSDEAKEIYSSIRHDLRAELPDAVGQRPAVYGVESYYTRLMGINGSTLRDSFHVGQTIANDYGRPYQPGFNAIFGASTIEEYGRFSLYVRGEYQHAPSADGYSPALSKYLSEQIDGIPYSGYNLHQDTIPAGPIGAANPFRLMEATLSFHVLGMEISGGKHDAWLGPAQGGAFGWSNNAENIYSFRINRVEPLHIPYLSALIGPMRYDFFYGSLKGHTAPNNPYAHSEIFSFEPTSNFQFAFQRTIIFGGAGHSPVTIGKFFHGFFNLDDTSPAVKQSRDDPGARFTQFYATYRLPFVRNYLTFYVDSFSHDDVTPVSAPRRAAFRPGLFLSQFPGMHKLDLRVEAASTDPKTSVSSNGVFLFREGIQQQGLTNKGFLFVDPIGREAKGGNAYLTYHLSGAESVQLSYMNKKNDKDFTSGTTQNQYKLMVVKRFLHDDLELNAWVQHEGWKAPLIATGKQSNTIGALQLTFYPGLKTSR